MLAAALACAPAAEADALAPAEARLLTQLRQIESRAGGAWGFSALRLCDARRIELNAAAPFPMAGSYNLLIGAAALARVDAGQIDPAHLAAIKETEIVPSDGVLDHFAHPGVAVSVENLVDLAIRRNDNTASDKLLELVGGPHAVTAWLRSRGIPGARVDRRSADQMRQFFGLGSGPIREEFARADASGELDRRLSALNPDYENDPRDTASARGLTMFLAALADGALLKPASTALLLSSMEHDENGRDRISAGLPSGAAVYHKSGSAGAVANDVALVRLPDGQRLVFAILQKNAQTPLEVRERAMADAVRLADQYYILAAPPCSTP